MVAAPTGPARESAAVTAGRYFGRCRCKNCGQKFLQHVVPPEKPFCPHCLKKDLESLEQISVIIS